MITTTRIKEEFDLILLGLQKRGLDLRSELEDILAQDDIRKRTQKELDDTLNAKPASRPKRSEALLVQKRRGTSQVLHICTQGARKSPSSKTSERQRRH